MRRLLALALAALAAPLMASPFGTLFAGERPAHVGQGTLAPCPATPNCVSSAASRAENAIAPIAFRGDPAAAMQRLAEAAKSLPGAKVIVAQPTYLHVEVASRVMGFVDDLEAVPDAAAGVIQVRSASRVGRSDFGVNRERVEALRAAMDAKSKAAP
jgi:uncharacterized protein (DUF1499 family)